MASPIPAPFVLAAAKLGYEEAPVVVARGWSEAQKRAYVIVDNKLTENGGWGDELLKSEMGALKALDYDLTASSGARKALALLFPMRPARMATGMNQLLEARVPLEKAMACLPCVRVVVG